MEAVKLSFTYLASPWAFGIAAGCVLLAALLSYARFFRGPHKGYVLILCVLRAIALAAALLVLMRPVLTYERVTPQERRLAVLIDASRSMSVRDAAGGSERFDAARRLAEGPIFEELARAFTVERLAFGGPAAPLAADTRPAAEETRLAEALRSAERGTLPLAGTVLLTDGNKTDAEQAASAVPLWAVPFGSGRGAWNLAVRDVVVEQVVLVENQTVIEAVVYVDGEAPRGELDSTLVLGDTEVGTQKLSCAPGLQRVRFTAVVRTAGRIAGAISVKPGPSEAFGEDNSRHFFLEVVKDRLGVVLYEPAPRWEATFVARSLRSDKNLQVAAVQRTASEQLKIDGVPPVPLKGGLPAAAADYRKVAAIVLGDVKRSDLLAEQPRELVAYVEGGGGLIIMAGRANLAGELADAGLAPLLPAVGIGPPKKADLRVQVKAAAHPVLRTLAGALASATVGDIVPLGTLKPGAEVLLAASGEGKETYPLLVVQRFGKGQVVIVATGSTWQWVMAQGAQGGKVLHERFWGQLVRWVAGRKEEDSGARLVLSRRVLNAGEEMTFAAQGAAGAGSVRITGPGGAQTLALAGDRREAPFTPELPGKYEAEWKAGETAVKELFFVEPNPLEREALAPREDALYELGRDSGGGLVRLPEARELPRRILRSFPGVLTEVETTPEKNPLLFIVFVVAAGLEWVLRRRLFTV